MAECDVFGNFEGDESLSYGSKNPAQAVPEDYVIRPTFQPATTSIAFLFRNHTLWDLNHHTSNSLESQQPMDMKHCPSSAGICHRHFCRFFSDRTDVQIRDFSAILSQAELSHGHAVFFR